MNLPKRIHRVGSGTTVPDQRENYAFIDGQNLYMATARKSIDPWVIDLARLRIYLRDKYGVSRAYYFLGYLDEERQGLYEEIQSAGFILVFREHTSAMLGKKKGNVDTDIVFAIMQKLYLKEAFGGVVLVSGDGDYKQLVDFLIREKRFVKILFPDRARASSLYKKLGAGCFAALDERDTRRKLEKRKAP